MRVYKVTPGAGRAPCIETEDEVLEWITGADVGETVMIEILEMSLAEYGALPEYQGP